MKVQLGVRAEADSLYHKNREFIGSTELREMSKSPKHFHEAWKNREYSEPTAAMVRGSVLHSVLLEQDLSKYVKRPVDDEGKQIAANTKVYKAWLETIGDKIPVAADLYDDLYKALSAFADNKRAMKLIEGAQIEQSVYAQDHESGLYVKARPDIWKGDVLIDLKTTEEINRQFRNRIFDFGYDFQMGHYSETIRSSGHNRIKDYYIIAFEAVAPFDLKIFRMDLGDIDAAINLRQQYLNEISVCVRQNKFPGYSDDIETVTKPNYMQKNQDLTFEVVS